MPFSLCHPQARDHGDPEATRRRMLANFEGKGSQLEAGLKVCRLRRRRAFNTCIDPLQLLVRCLEQVYASLRPPTSLRPLTLHVQTFDKHVDQLTSGALEKVCKLHQKNSYPMSTKRKAPSCCKHHLHFHPSTPQGW